MSPYRVVVTITDPDTLEQWHFLASKPVSDAVYARTLKHLIESHVLISNYNVVNHGLIPNHIPHVSQVLFPFQQTDEGPSPPLHKDITVSVQSGAKTLSECYVEPFDPNPFVYSFEYTNTIKVTSITGLHVLFGRIIGIYNKGRMLSCGIPTIDCVALSVGQFGTPSQSNPFTVTYSITNQTGDSTVTSSLHQHQDFDHLYMFDLFNPGFYVAENFGIPKVLHALRSFNRLTTVDDLSNAKEFALTTTVDELVNVEFDGGKITFQRSVQPGYPLIYKTDSDPTVKCDLNVIGKFESTDALPPEIKIQKDYQKTQVFDGVEYVSDKTDHEPTYSRYVTLQK